MQATLTNPSQPDPETLQYMEQQSQIFEAHRHQLLQTHTNQFVWFEAGQILDADADFTVLFDRVILTAGDRPTFIRQVLPVDPQPQVRTPLRTIATKSD